MFEPLIKNLVRKLDIAAEAYLERQQMINLLAVPGTLLFLLLFCAAGASGGQGPPRKGTLHSHPIHDLPEGS